LAFCVVLQPSMAAAHNVVINNFNRQAVQNSPLNPSRIVVKKSCVLACLKTYHFNEGKSSKAIQLGLKKLDGTSLGNWDAKQENVLLEGAKTALPLMWVCKPNLTLEAGEYVIFDSDPSTWSCNKNSGMRGFFSVTLTAAKSSLQSTGTATSASMQSETEVPQIRQVSDQYNRYVNPRFQFGIDFPAQLKPGEEPENGDGRRFLSPDGSVDLTAYGQSAFATVDGTKWTLASLLADSLAHRKQDGDQVTFSKKGRDWIVVSGFSGDKIFYYKAMIHNDFVKCFEINYPKSRKLEFDPVVSHVANSFTNTSPE
ncbi:MAG: hypothetical protein K2X81_01280, partial [Candidatus Obscuribacterales bacterium]|nr:hypothetical protein [Candidatus Obscuribacterales bacterium]